MAYSFKFIIGKMPIITASLFTMLSFSQENDNNPMMTEYVSGKPHMRSLEIKREIAKQWGFDIHYVDGVGSDGKLEKMIALGNKEVHTYLDEKYGKDWYALLNKQVSLNLSPWFLEIYSFKGFLNSDTLILTTKTHKSKIRFKSDGSFFLDIYDPSNLKKEKDADQATDTLYSGTYKMTMENLELHFWDGVKQEYHYNIQAENLMLKLVK